LEFSPPEHVARWLLGILPALGAAAFAAASAVFGALPPSRRLALRDTCEGADRASLDRYIQSGAAIEARWLALRVVGIASSALVFFEQWRATLLGTPLVGVGAAAALSTLLTYGLATAVLLGWFLRHPERTAPVILRSLRPLELIAVPLAAPMVWVGALLGRNDGPPTPPADVAENEVEILVSESEQAGALDHEQSEMIRNVIDFGDLTAAEVMVPRTRVTAFELEIAPRELLARVLEAEHSRYPIYRERIDGVVGILHVKDLLAHVARGDIESFQLEKVMRGPVVFVPSSQPASSVLRDMRVRRQHLAIVLDEYGGMSGVVSLEDLIEEIVGEIHDEHDQEEPAIIELDGGRLLVDASVPLEELSRYLKANLPEDGEYNSLGGFIVERLGRVPRSGARLNAHGLEFIVREANDRRIAKVEVARQNSLPPDSPHSHRSGTTRTV
jgi:CBS domain containing-hemolysin-like protein